MAEKNLNGEQNANFKAHPEANQGKLSPKRLKILGAVVAGLVLSGLVYDSMQTHEHNNSRASGEIATPPYPF